ncbi:hypothetical protein BJ138DRAFT_1178994 [Hygrophoropsis aurantiaca]|uniref:Uncharacterized protein n=1 Tax=Hygrophoropsis aurantiaca TaxID=72124 RepID=A0ACB8AFQ1_9AGAM|nr:hypothetical protein BJ138DRAFT_1178994 [Hygrophoropsis aurantiaca]
MLPLSSRTIAQHRSVNSLNASISLPVIPEPDATRASYKRSISPLQDINRRTPDPHRSTSTVMLAIEEGLPIEPPSLSAVPNSRPSDPHAWLSPRYRPPNCSVKGLAPSILSRICNADSSGSMVLDQDGTDQGDRDVDNVDPSDNLLTPASTQPSNEDDLEVGEHLALASLKVRQILAEIFPNHPHGLYRLPIGQQCGDSFVTARSSIPLNIHQNTEDNNPIKVLECNGHTFTVTDLLGSGSFATVWSAYTEGGDQVVIKMMNKRKMLDDRFAFYDLNFTIENAYQLDDDLASAVSDEFEVLKRVTDADCPFLTPLLCSSSDNENFYFVLVLHFHFGCVILADTVHFSGDIRKI